MSRLSFPACVALLAAAASAPAAEPDVLRFMPKQAGLVLTVESPRRLAKVVADQDAFRRATALPAVREVLDGTAVRRGAAAARPRRARDRRQVARAS